MSSFAARLARSWQQPRPDALARALQPLSWLYGAAAAARRATYDSRLRARERAPRPLVVVGNLVAGGAGKTPTVIALVALLRAMGWRPGVVSRGYGRQARDTRLISADAHASEVGDEPLLIHRRSGVPVAVAARRIDAARALCQAHPEVSVLVADDGLQHHALARDAQLIVFDERGAGNGLLLPAGPLREPLPRAVPPHTLVIYNAAQPSTPLPGTLASRALGEPVELARWWQREPQIGGPGWAALAGRRVIACAGTALPQRFFAMLRSQGLEVDPLPLPDHADFDRLPWPADAADVVVTEKDAVKIDPRRLDRTRVWVAPLDLRLDAEVGTTLARWLPPPSP